jgi:hypothetical protein
MTADATRRKSFRELLGLLASEEQQLTYERDVPFVDITVELVCMWFDDLYDEKRADRDVAFTAEERAALADFHQFYKERVDMLPASQGTVRTWLASPVWSEVMERARKTLEVISA